MSTQKDSSRVYKPVKRTRPDIVDLRDVIDCIIDWGGRFEVGDFSTGKRYLVETTKLGMSGDNFRDLCRNFVKEAAKIRAEERKHENK